MRASRLLAGAAVVAAALTAAAVTAATGVSAAVPARSVPAVNLLAVRYVALGDSYSAGTGAGASVAPSGSCDRSADAFPEQWADHHATASFVSVACSGATVSSILSGQLAALTVSTTLVSITVGGDDAGFSHVMETCVLEWDSACLHAVSSAESYIAATLPGRLTTVLGAIRAHAPSAKVMVLDYPHLYDLSRSADCIGLSTTKRTALNQAADDLDRALSTAAARDGDVFVDVRNQFSGHEICDGGGSWLNAVTFPIDDSYHPNAAGQELGYLPAFSAAGP